MAAPDILDREVTDLTVANTLTETVIFTHSVPGGTITAEGVLRFHLVGDYLNNNATTDNLRFRIKFGGTEIYNDAMAVAAISASRRPFNLEFCLANQGATNDQIGGGTALLGTAGGATVGIGNLSTASIEAVTPLVSADSALDSGVAQVFEATLQWDVANANLSFRRRLAVLVVDRVVAPGLRVGSLMLMGVGR